MTRPWMVSASTAAFAAGMMLVHCSSSSSTGTGTSSGSSTAKTSTSGSSATTSGPGASTTVPHDSGTSGVTGASTSVQSTSSGSSGSTGSTGLTDTHDAGPCVGPAGGEACDPGNVECNNMQCAVPGHTCCLPGSGTGGACLGVTATCSGDPQACDEKSDCPDGQICCLDVTDINGDFKISCQSGTTCPAGTFAGAQICKTNAECSTGACSLYSCEGNITEACQAPNAICTKM